MVEAMLPGTELARSRLLPTRPGCARLAMIELLPELRSIPLAGVRYSPGNRLCV
jgi:hypothetical protein